MPITLQNEIAIKKQINDISTRLTNNMVNIKYHRNRLPKVISSYKIIRDNLKNYMIKNGEAVIDRHKVCAAMTLAILRENVIEITDPKKASYQEKSANIFLTYILSQAIIEDFYYAEKEVKLIFLTPRIYMKEYQKLIFNNKNILQSIATRPTFEYSQVLFFLSHIFYLMELHSKEVTIEA
ncbi:MAG: hypothetical protein WCW84_11360 [Sulfurimonas sp.]|jgi:hypothetical protein